MDRLPIKPERRAQLEEYAQLREQSPEDALDQVLADYFGWQQQDDEETAAVLEAEADISAGRTKPAGEVYKTLRRKYGFPD